MDVFLTSYDLADLRFRETGAVTEVRLKKRPMEETEESDNYERDSYDYKCDGKFWL
jgi:hypothetical protein